MKNTIRPDQSAMPAEYVARLITDGEMAERVLKKKGIRPLSQDDIQVLFG